MFSIVFKPLFLAKKGGKTILPPQQNGDWCRFSTCQCVVAKPPPVSGSELRRTVGSVDSELRDPTPPEATQVTQPSTNWSGLGSPSHSKVGDSNGALFLTCGRTEARVLGKKSCRPMAFGITSCECVGGLFFHLFQ